MTQKKNEIGKKFGMLTVLHEAEPIPRKDKSGWKRRVYHCRCDCGNEIDVSRDSLVTGNTRSCGCLNGKGRPARRKTHGSTHTRLYRIWCHMKGRCNDAGNNRYYCYGARGIKLCTEWESSFEKFKKWAEENGYTDELTIERINNDLGYCPENCKWIPLAEQSKNRRICNGKQKQGNGA